MPHSAPRFLTYCILDTVDTVSKTAKVGLPGYLWMRLKNFPMKQLKVSLVIVHLTHCCQCNIYIVIVLTVTKA